MGAGVLRYPALAARRQHEGIRRLVQPRQVSLREVRRQHMHRRQLVRRLPEPRPRRAPQLHRHPLAARLRVEVGIVPMLGEGAQDEADVVGRAELLPVGAEQPVPALPIVPGVDRKEVVALARAQPQRRRGRRVVERDIHGLRHDEKLLRVEVAAREGEDVEVGGHPDLVLRLEVVHPAEGHAVRLEHRAPHAEHRALRLVLAEEIARGAVVDQDVRPRQNVLPAARSLVSVRCA